MKYAARSNVFFLATRVLISLSRAAVRLVLVTAIPLSSAAIAHAGGGPENVLLLVNSNSASSKAIANFYIELRRIPPTNVVYVDWKGSLEGGSGARFRDEILQSAIKALDDRHLTMQVDYLVYSTDFPWWLDIQSIYPDHKFKAPFDPKASITGATYLLSYIIGNQPSIVMPDVNWYVPGLVGANQGQCTQLENVRSHGFRSRYGWEPGGEISKDSPRSGQRYLLSTMLGVTQGRGNTEDEIRAYLRRAAAADGTRPQGTIYFMWNKDVRSATRDKCFASVASQINAAGVPAKVRQGVLPNGANDVTGLMVGASDFDLNKAGMTIRPGAICEHLTSAGGLLSKPGYQTPLSEFLRHGAAGASGTITEPRAIQAKFPLPSLQLHYARGCSLAEAFYQSIAGPYQILIVGDPLCQPWAVAPKVFVEGIIAGQTVKGTISVKPAAAPGSRPIGFAEIFIDGCLVAGSPPGNTLEIDTTKLADGYHEMRVVGAAADAIEARGRIILPFNVRNTDATLECKVSPERSSIAGKFRVELRQPGATAITVWQNKRELGRVKGDAGSVEISAATLGRGTTTLQTLSEGKTAVASPPIRVQVD